MADDGVRIFPRSAVLADVEACRRRKLLLVLQAELADRGVRSLLIGRHILTLRASAPFEPCGPADPELHLLDTPDGDVITTDSVVYRMKSGHAFPADDPAIAAQGLLIPP